MLLAFVFVFNINEKWFVTELKKASNIYTKQTSPLHLFCLLHVDAKNLRPSNFIIKALCLPQGWQNCSK